MGLAFAGTLFSAAFTFAAENDDRVGVFSVAKDCGAVTAASASGNFAPGEEVTFSAEASDGWTFYRWVGADLPEGHELDEELTLRVATTAADIDLTAIFTDSFINVSTAAELTDAVAEANSLEKCVIILEPGTYAVSELEVSSSGTVLRSRGNDPETVTISGGTGNNKSQTFIVSAPTGTFAPGFSGLTIADAAPSFNFTGNDALINKCNFLRCGLGNGTTTTPTIFSAATSGTITIHDCYIASAEGRNGVFNTALSTNARNLNVLDSVFENNSVGFHCCVVHEGGTGIVRVERCVFRGNKGDETGAIRASSGTLIVENCLFYKNNGGIAAGAISIRNSSSASSRVQNCTFVGNGTPVVQLGIGTIANCVFNKSVGVSGSVGGMGNKSYIYSSCYPESTGTPSAPDANGNFAADPQFVAPYDSDLAIDLENRIPAMFRLSADSPCVDITSSQVDPLDCDLLGTLRAADGNGDGVAVADMGCFEARSPIEGPFGLDIAVSRKNVIVGESIQLSAVALGAEREIVGGYQWTINRSVNGVAAADISFESSDPVVTFENIPVGFFTIHVSAANTAGETATATYLGGTITSLPAKTYVNPANSAGQQWPYDSEATAAVKIQDAIDSVFRGDATRDGGVVELAPAQYTPSNTGYHSTMVGFDTRNYMAEVNHSICITSRDGAETVIINANSTSGGIVMRSPRAVLDCVTVSGAWVNGIVRMENGIMRNCIVRNCTGHRAIFIADGDFVDNVVENNTPSGDMGIIYVSSRARIENCLIRGNTSSNANANGIIYSNESSNPTMNIQVRNCTIENNGLENKAIRRIVYFVGGRGSFSVERCVISNNRSSLATVSMAVPSSVISDCLIANNKLSGTVTSGKEFAAGICLSSTGYITNCTVTANANVGGNSTGNESDGISIMASNCQIVNTICYDNGTVAHGGDNDGNIRNIYSTQPTLKIVNSCYGASTVHTSTITENCISDNPLFRDVENGNYALMPKSPCRNAGVTVASMRDEVDLFGKPRLVGRSVDIGAIESSDPGTKLILR